MTDRGSAPDIDARRRPDPAPCAATSRRGEPIVLERRRSNDDPRRSGIERGGDDFLVSESAGDFDPDAVADGLDDLADHGRMGRRSVARTVEIDDMEPASAGVGEPPGDGDGLRREGGLPGEIALLKANDAASPEVDRREDLEPACRSHGAMLSY